MPDSAISYADVQAAIAAIQNLSTACNDQYSALNPFANAIQGGGLIGTDGDQLVQVLNQQTKAIQDLGTFCANTVNLLNKVMAVYQQIDQGQASQAGGLG